MDVWSRVVDKYCIGLCRRLLDEIMMRYIRLSRISDIQFISLSADMRAASFNLYRTFQMFNFSGELPCLHRLICWKSVVIVKNQRTVGTCLPHSTCAEEILTQQSESRKDSGGVVKNILCVCHLLTCTSNSLAFVAYGLVWSDARKSDNLSFQMDNMLPNWQSSL